MDMMSYLMGRNSGGGGKGAKIEVVTELPETGEANVIYLVPKETEDENNVFDEYLYINNEWELIGSTAIDISGKQDTMQFSTMPTASADYLGKIVQYTGTTNANYTNGYFYICVGTTENDVTTYSWSNVKVQESNQNAIDTLVLETSDLDFGEVLAGRANSWSFDYTSKNYLQNFLRKMYEAGKEYYNIVFYATSIGGRTVCFDLRYGQYKLSNKSTALEMYSSLQPDINIVKSNSYIYQLSVRLSWSGDVLTVTSASISNKGGIPYLNKNNATSYTPTGDYNPATKKYVDDSIAAAITTTLGGSY